MASETTVARESRAEPINAVSRSGGTREGLLRTMASQMSRARTNEERERIYKAASEESKRLTGKVITRQEAESAMASQAQRFSGGYDSYLTHLQRSGGFSNVINQDYDKALLRHEKEGTLTPKERDALITLKYRKKHMGV